MNSRIRQVILVAVLIIITGCAYFVYSIPRNSGTITVSGAFALYPLMVEWADEYQAIHNGIKIEVSAGGAGKGMTDALSGLVDLGMVSREIYPEEVAKGAVWVSVAIDAVVVTVSEDNPVIEDLMARGVTPSLLRKVFITGEITTWGQMVNRSDITDVINRYTRSDACGAAETFAKYLGYKQEDLLGVGVYGDPGLAEAVKKDVLSLGYNNVNYAYDIITGKPVDGVLVVPLDINEDGMISSDEEFYGDRDTMIDAIASGLYPSPPSRSLNLVTKDRFKGIVQDFVQWILTDGQEYAVTAGYVPISPERRVQELAKLGK